MIIKYVLLLEWNQNSKRNKEYSRNTTIIRLQSFFFFKKKVFKTFYNTIIFPIVDVKLDPILFSDLYNLSIFFIRECIFKMDLI